MLLQGISLTPLEISILNTSLIDTIWKFPSEPCIIFVRFLCCQWRKRSTNLWLMQFVWFKISLCLVYSYPVNNMGGSQEGYVSWRCHLSQDHYQASSEVVMSDLNQTLASLVHNIRRSLFHMGFGHFCPTKFQRKVGGYDNITGHLMKVLLFSGWYIIASLIIHYCGSISTLQFTVTKQILMWYNGPCVGVMICQQIHYWFWDVVYGLFPE